MFPPSDPTLTQKAGAISGKRTTLSISSRARTGINVIGHRDKNGSYHVNPSPETILAPDESFIVLGNEEQLENLHRMLEDEQKG